MPAGHKLQKPTKAKRRSSLGCFAVAPHTERNRRSVSFSENGNVSNLAKTHQNEANHESDFDPPIYNIWKQQTKSDGSSHFGNSESRWVDNLFRGWLSRIDKDQRERRKQQVFDLWLACQSNVEIAADLSCDEKHVREVIGEMADMPKLRKVDQNAANHEK